MARKRKNKNKSSKPNATVKAVVTADSPVLEVPSLENDTPTTEVETVVAESDEGSEQASQGNSPSDKPSDCDTESQEEKLTKSEAEAEARETPSSKEEDEVFLEGMKKYRQHKKDLEDSTEENTTTERENEKAEDTSTAEDSNPTTAPNKDSSKTPTTPKSEQPVAVKTTLDEAVVQTGEVPHWIGDMVKRGWLQDHGSILRDDGAKIELHACLGFTDDGKPIKVPVRDVEKPSTAGLDKFAKDAVFGQFNSEVNEARTMRAKTLLEMYKDFAKRMPRLLPNLRKNVHVWNNKRDKELNLVGELVGLQGGRTGWTVMINVTGKDGVVKLVRRGFKYFSDALPNGEKQVSLIPLRKATDVEKEADKKLLEDKRTTLIEPEGYQSAKDNLLEGQRFHTILVWNSGGKQLSFHASPVNDEEGNYQWRSIEHSMSGHLQIHNDAIAMKGSVEELMRTTIKVNQEQINDLLFVSIPETDFGQMATFLEVMGMCAISEDSNNGTETETIKE